jgi:hypothetical protein
MPTDLKESAMTCIPQPLETLVLWRLLANGGGDFDKDIKPKLNKSRRDKLVRAGLIAVVKQEDSRTGHRCNHVALTDKGWQWAETHLDQDVSRSPAAGPILQSIMTRLKTHLAYRQLSLAAFIEPACDTGADNVMVCNAGMESGPQGDQHPSDTANANAADPMWPTNGSAKLQSRVVSTCRKLANGRPAARIRLANLRAALTDVSRKQLDMTLLDMEASESVVLYPLDNPRELSPDDLEAALPNSAGFNRHIIYLEN